MGGDHHHHKVVVPDYRIYKVDEIPELARVKKKLAEKGLSDPWLRNEAWRYQAPQWKGVAHNVRVFVTRGMLSGSIMFGLTLAYEAWAKPYDRPHNDHNDHH